MTAAELLCGSCGTELPPDSRFCNKCGAPVRPAATAAEYKQVTVLFAELVIRVGGYLRAKGRFSRPVSTWAGCFACYGVTNSSEQTK